MKERKKKLSSTECGGAQAYEEYCIQHKVELRNKEYDRIQKMEQEAAAKDEESRQAMMLYSSSHAVFVAAHLSDKPLTAALEKIVRHPLIKTESTLSRLMRA
jgi:hypothetical protein